MLDRFVALTKAVAHQVQASLAEQAPALAQELDLPQRQRFLELLARGFDTFVHGLARATQSNSEPGAPSPLDAPRESAAAAAAAAAAREPITLGPRPYAAAAAASLARGEGGGASADSSAAAAAWAADDEAFARKFAQLFLDMGGIYPKLAQVLSIRPDLIKDERVLLRLRAVQEECRRMPFDEARALVARESLAFRDGSYELRDWARYVHAGSIAQVAPFVISGGPSAAAVPGDGNAAEANEGTPDGVVKLTFIKARELMEVDFRLLRSQLHWMERTGHWTGATGLHALRPKHLGKLREVWRLMVEMESEVLAEFDLRGEAECQQRGEVVIEGLLGSAGDCVWLEEWRDGALVATLRPAGPSVAGHAREAWRSAAAPGARTGLLTRLARRAYGGRALAEGLAEGEEHVARLRGALRRLRVKVPRVHLAASGQHVLAMEVAEGRSLKEVLDVISQSPKDQAQKAAAWFAALLLFVIVPLWGKMLLVVGCCHADPHPGNFKVGGIPGLEEVMPQPAAPAAQRSGLLRRLVSGSAPRAREDDGPAPLTLWVLDWGSCVVLDDAVRQTLCKLLISLSALRAAERRVAEAAQDAAAQADQVQATKDAAECIRKLGVQAGPDQDPFLAALGMALFDPSVAASHPELRGGKAEELGRSFTAGSGIGKILRVVAILVGICRELERRLNDEAAERLQASGGTNRAFVELFLVDLWRPFAEEGLA